MAATGFGIALLLRKSREGNGYLSPPKIQKQNGFRFSPPPQPPSYFGGGKLRNIKSFLTPFRALKSPV